MFIYMLFITLTSSSRNLPFEFDQDVNIYYSHLSSALIEPNANSKVSCICSKNHKMFNEPFDVRHDA